MSSPGTARNGAVLFVSPAAETLFGARVGELHRPSPVRARACRRPAGLSEGAGRCRRARRGAQRRVPRAPRPRRRRPHARIRQLHLGRDALPSARSATRPGLDREVVAVMRDVTERKASGAGDRGHARGGRPRQRRQEPLPRHHEPRAAHAAQRHHRLLRDADAGGAAAARRRAPPRLCAADQRFRHASAVGGQRHPRHVEDGDRRIRRSRRSRSRRRR